MGQPHKHAEFIKAKADGKNIQERRVIGEWHDMEEDDWIFDDNFEYRIKPDPPKYPETRMNGEELFDAFYDVLGHKCTLSLVAAPGVHLVVDDGFIGIANAAIARAIDDKQVFAADSVKQALEAGLGCEMAPAAMLEKVALEVQKACKPTFIGTGGGCGGGGGCADTSVHGGSGYSNAMQVYVPNPDLSAIIAKVKEGK